ncbi:MAG: hypothetical protein IPK19_40580 [Chloroflexi bacterium]|nr:hypothetical protein [Chloroflexota bacterium]
MTKPSRERWDSVAQGLPIPRRADGLVLQCEDFEGQAEIDFAALWQDRSKGFASQVSQERLYRSRCLKQSKRAAAHAALPRRIHRCRVRQAWDYYFYTARLVAVRGCCSRWWRCAWG